MKDISPQFCTAEIEDALNHPRKFVDLHTHTTASDGSLSPADLVKAADRAKLAAIAITDHDTFAGVLPAIESARDYPNLRIIPGIEISADYPRGVLHILGLGADLQNQALIDLAAELRAQREKRNPQIIEKLRAVGVDITLEEVLAKAGSAHAKVVSRVHFAQVLIEKKYVKTVSQAFSDYLSKGAPGFVKKDQTPPARAIEILKSACKIVSLAHPSQLRCDNRAQLELLVRQFKQAGLNAIECYHSSHTQNQTRIYTDLAVKYDLAITGGSDFHGQGKPDVILGHPRMPISLLSQELLLPGDSE